MNNLCHCTIKPSHQPVDPTELLALLTDSLEAVALDVCKLILQYAQCPVYFMKTQVSMTTTFMLSRWHLYTLQKDPVTWIRTLYRSRGSPPRSGTHCVDAESSMLLSLYGTGQRFLSGYCVWDLRKAEFLVTETWLPKHAKVLRNDETEFKWVFDQDTLYVKNDGWTRLEGIVSGKWRDTTDGFWRTVSIGHRVFVNRKFVIIDDYDAFHIRRVSQLSHYRILIRCPSYDISLVDDFLFLLVRKRWFVIDLECLFFCGRLLCLELGEECESVNSLHTYHYDRDAGVLCFREGVGDDIQFVREMLTTNPIEMKDPTLRINPKNPPLDRQLLRRSSSPDTLLLHKSCKTWKLLDKLIDVQVEPHGLFKH